MFDKLLLNRLLFILMCTVIFLSPLPLGSNREWAWPVFALIFAFMAMIILLAEFINKPLVQLNKLLVLKGLLILVGLWLFVGLLYLIPLPVAVVEFISPTVAGSYKMAGMETAYLTVDVFASFLHLLQSFYYALVLLIVVLLTDSRKRTLAVLGIILASGVFESLYGMYLVSVGKTGLWFTQYLVSEDSASGTFVNRNHFVAYLAISFFAGLVIRLNYFRGQNIGQGLMRKFVGFVVNPARLIDFTLIVIAAGIWNTHSRSGVFSFLIGFLFFVTIMVILNNRCNFKKIVLMLVVAGVLMLPLLWPDLLVLQKSLGLGMDSQEIVFDQRYNAYLQVFENFSKFWFTGVGPGAYSVFFVNQRTAEHIYFFDHVHNDYLEFLIEFGLFSIIILLMLFWVIRRLIVNVRTKSHLQKTLMLAAMSSVIYMLLHGLLDFNFRIPANVVVLVVVLALALKRQKRKKH